LGGNFISEPAVARNSDGRLEVFVIGADHALYHDFQQTAGSSSSWSGFTKLGGSILSNPVVGQDRDGRLEVFVIGGNHALSHIFELTPSSSNSWSGFSGLGGSSLISDPAVASNSDGRLEVFVIGNDHALYHIFEQAASSSNSWSGLSYLDGVLLSNTNPAVALNSEGQLQAFVVGLNNAIYYKFQVTPGSISWTGYASLGGYVISNPVISTNSDGRLELFVTGSDHALWHNFQLSALDQFGITELYPSKTNGEHYTMNMQSESNDPQFDPNGSTLTKNADGTYNTQSSSVRLQIFTSTGFHENQIKTLDQVQLAAQGYMQSPNDWKNVEITGYLKPNHFTTSTTNGAAHIEYVARGARNTNDNYLVGSPPLSAQCEATTYHSNTYMTGRVKFEKDLMHTAGYTANSQDPQILNAVNVALGKWVGIKAVYYNFPNGTVKLEQWVDDSTDNINAPGNKWHKVLDFNDHGQWGGGQPNCGGTPSTIITWGGPIALFRWDNIDNMDFKDFSIREIQPPQ
jgi:acylphosphatase